MLKAEAVVITSKEYLELDHPQFEGQTKVSPDGRYSMFFSCKGILYRIDHQDNLLQEADYWDGDNSAAGC